MAEPIFKKKRNILFLKECISFAKLCVRIKASCWSISFSLLLLLVPMIPTWKGTNQESCLKLIWSTRWCESWMSVFDLRKIILYTFKEKRIAIWLLNNCHPLSAVKSFLSALDSNLQLLEISRGQLISFDLQVFQEKLIERGKEKKKELMMHDLTTHCNWDHWSSEVVRFCSRGEVSTMYLEIPLLLYHIDFDWIFHFCFPSWYDRRNWRI